MLKPSACIARWPWYRRHRRLLGRMLGGGAQRTVQTETSARRAPGGNMSFLRIARGLVAVASAGRAILSLAFRDFAPLGQALPGGTPGRDIWLYGSALLLLVASSLCF